LTGSRFRRVFQELDRLQKREHQIAEALAELRAELNGEVAYCADDDSGYDEGVQFAITKLDEMRVKLGLETQ
jgi:ABC-type phosphate transport system auxiliary subunit